MHPKTNRIHEIGARPHANLRRYSADCPAPNIPYAPGPDATLFLRAIQGSYLSCPKWFPILPNALKEQLPVTCVRAAEPMDEPERLPGFPEWICSPVFHSSA